MKTLYMSLIHGNNKKVFFINSMSDLFHENVPLEFIKTVFHVMNNTEHMYQVVTKRADILFQCHTQLRWKHNI